MSLTVDQILALAPDVSARKAGQDLAKRATWSGLGRAGATIFGEVEGIVASPYRTLWRAYGDGKITEAEAKSLSELIDARYLSLGGQKTGQSSNPTATATDSLTLSPKDRAGSPKRAVGSRPRTGHTPRWSAVAAGPPRGGFHRGSQPGSRWPSRRSSPAWRLKPQGEKTADCRSRIWEPSPACAARRSRHRMTCCGQARDDRRSCAALDNERQCYASSGEATSGMRAPSS
jgi:hypothetical protein